MFYSINIIYVETDTETKTYAVYSHANKTFQVFQYPKQGTDLNLSIFKLALIPIRTNILLFALLLISAIISTNGNQTHVLTAVEKKNPLLWITISQLDRIETKQYLDKD